MQISEGQIYQGTVTALGAEGPAMHWIVVSPHGKCHAHSLGDPLDLHCMPLGILEQAIAAGRLAYVETQAAHPVIQLQHAKQAAGIVDAHMGLHGDKLQKMVRLLESGVAENVEYVPYLAGEILSLATTGLIPGDQLAEVRNKVRQLLQPQPGH